MQDLVHKFAKENPFAQDGEDVASVGYRYRKWALSKDLVLVARCEHDAAFKDKAGQDAFMNIKTLNEWDPKRSGIDWRQKLDMQRGAVLATEMKNNACKLAKWTVQSLLAGSAQLRLGYVSRVAPNNPSSHVVLGTQSFTPQELATQISLNANNSWGECAGHSMFGSVWRESFSIILCSRSDS